MKQLLAFLFLAAPLSAQVPQCKISQPTGNQANYSCSLAVQAGQTLVAPFVGSVKSISDSQQNTWTIDQQTLQLSFAHAPNAAQTGTDVVMFTMSGPAALNAVVLAYPSASGVSVSPIGHGSSTSAQSLGLPATAGSTAVAFGTQWTNSFQIPSGIASGFMPESAGSVWVADEPISTAGNVSGSATYSAAVNWFAGIAVLASAIPPPPPPKIDTLTLNVQLFNCTTCTMATFSTADWTPLAAGNAYQGATLTLYQVTGGNTTSLLCSATLGANAQASCSGGLNVAPPFLTLTYTVQSPGGQTLVAAGAFSFTAPVLSFTSAVGGNVNVWLGFDSATMAPRFGAVGSS